MILEPLNSQILYNILDKLITNEKKLLTLQKKIYLNFMFTHKYIAEIIDSIRKSLILKSSINLFNIKKNNTLKILHITNFNHRFNGRLHYNTGRRLNNGFIRLGHNVLTVSDRDIINKSKNILD